MFYFDNAATTFPKPRGVVDAVRVAIVDYGSNPGRSGHQMAMKVSEKIYLVRKKVAAFFNGQPETVIFTQNCTMSLNMAIKGVLKKGDHVICSCLEHNSVIRPLYKLQSDDVITYSVAKVSKDDAETVSAFRALINSSTKLIVCTYASNVTGHVMPIHALGKLCKEYGITFIVDAAQAAGVVSIDMQEDYINALCVPGHKGLYGITGSGILLLNNIELLDTLLEGGTGSLSVELEQPDFYPDRMEAGTINTAGILSIEAGLNFISNRTINQIYQHEQSLCDMIHRELSKNPKIQLYSGSHTSSKTVPIVAFNVGDEHSEQMVQILNQSNCALRGGLHCAPLAHEHYKTLDRGMVRFSPSAFTKEWEALEFVKIIQNISKKIPI